MLVRGAARQMALLFADIDDFKRVNDTLGHDAGDEVLVQFSNRIRDVMECNDDGNATLARFGGDEFVILLELPDDSGTVLWDPAAKAAAPATLRLRLPIPAPAHNAPQALDLD